MANPELVGRLLAGVSNYQARRGGGGNPELTRAELAGMLAGLSSIHMSFCYAKYAGSESAALETKRAVLVRARTIAKVQRWQFDGGRPTLENMSSVVVYEAITPPVCGKCQGAGYVVSMGRGCAVCNGTGVLSLSGRIVAKNIEISEASYRKDWARRYADLLGFLQGLDADIWRALRIADR